jgi:hypothetical protein
MKSGTLPVSALLLLFATTAQGAIGAGDEGNGTSLTFGTLLDENRKLTLDQIELSLAPNGPLEMLGGLTGSVTWLDADRTLLFREATLVDPSGSYGADFGPGPIAGSLNSSGHANHGLFGAAAPLGQSLGDLKGNSSGGIGSGIGSGFGSLTTAPGGAGPYSGLVQLMGPGNGSQSMTLDVENMPHLPEPSTLVIFCLGSLGLAFPALSRPFRKTT